MDRVKFEKLKIGDVIRSEKERFLITKIELETGRILLFNDHFNDIVMSSDYAEKYCYYVESLDMAKVVSFLQGHEWWDDIDEEAAE